VCRAQLADQNVHTDDFLNSTAQAITQPFFTDYTFVWQQWLLRESTELDGAVIVSVFSLSTKN
jgi:hypothetical protein